jgi:hypothetical protein
MLLASFVVLAIAVVAGSVLMILHLRAAEGVPRPPWPLPAFHAVLALAGLACLFIGLEGPPRGAASGTQSFGAIAAGFLVLAALVGARILYARVRAKRRAEILIGVHATLAVFGFVLLIAYVFS